MKANQLKASLLQFALEGRFGNLHQHHELVTHNISESISLEIPQSWEVKNLGDIATVVRGGSPRPISNYITDDDEGINWIKIGDTTIGGKYIESTKQKIKPSALNKTRLIHEGDFLLSNSMSFGRPYISKITGAIHDGWLAISDYEDKLDRNFLYYFLSSNNALKQFQSLVSGTTVKNLTKDKVKSIYIPIPNLDEQLKIVKKIESMVEKVKQYDILEQKITELNITFPSNMEKSILQYAMQGRLVSQHPGDEPVKELLNYIKFEQEKFLADNKIRKPKLPLPINYDEVPFSIPDSWEWVRLSQVGCVISGGTPKTSEPLYWDPNGIVWLTPKDMGKRREMIISDSSRRISTLGLEKSSAKLIPEGSILFSSRAPIGYINIVDTEYTTNQGCKSVVPFIYNKFLYYVLKGFSTDIEKMASGTTFKEISGSNFSQTLIPVPPLKEQQRIVEKIEELLNFINKLKSLNKIISH